MTDPALTGLVGACCTAVAIRGLVLVRSPSAVERRELRAELAEETKRRGPTRRLLDLVGARFGPRLLARTSESGRKKIQQRLDLAGRPGGMNLERYGEVKAALLVVAVLFAIGFAAMGSWPLVLLVLALGWIGLDVWLSRTGRRRQAQLERDVPDFIDILSITVRAGTGYRAALGRVASSLSGPCAEEVTTTLRQMDLGATRREAFEALRARNDSPTLTSFVGAQLQAEELGVSLADALANIAADTRRAAAQSARRRAQKTAPRVTLITATLLLPATVLVIGVGMFIGSNVHLSHLFG